MKKYKLIKDYPNCPINVGTIVKWDIVAEEYVTDLLPANEGFKEDTVEKFPEFWEEVKESEFEILDRKYIPGHRCSGTPELMWEIISIKRLKDNKIFTIGDLCYPKNKPVNCGKITGFDILENGSFRIASRYKWYLGINDIEHSKPKPLFTTEDGVDIFEGDYYYNIYQMQICSKLVAKNKIKEGSLVFSTKEKAEEYIEMNEPKFSKQEILDIIRLDGDEYSDGEVIDMLYELINK